MQEHVSLTYCSGLSCLFKVVFHISDLSTVSKINYHFIRHWMPNKQDKYMQYSNPGSKLQLMKSSRLMIDDAHGDEQL